IPVSLALFSSEGRALPLQRAGDAPASAAHIERVYEMTGSVETWMFEGVPERPVPSLLRGFSAPVRLNYPWTRQQLMFLMRHDTDGFNRWDAGQQLAIQAIHEAQDALASGDSWQPDAALIDTYRHLLEDPDADLALVARMLQLPSESWLIDLADPADPLRIHSARERVLRTLAEALGDTLMACYDRHYLPDMPYDLKAAAMARRALCNTVLTWLMAVDHPQGLARAVRQYQGATNLTERAGALRALSLTSNVTERQAALDDFYNRFQHDPQVIEQWFSIQASSPRCGALGQIRQLIAHPAFDWRNPNKVRAVVGTFANQNLVHFHAIDGAGYAFLADCIQDLDARNPQVAARLATPLTRWKKYDGERREQMQRALARIQARPGLSPDVYEVVSKSLLA
ncbi:MAG: DUF3458 domain-containing protein, partial [Gammaproteobacteria bacterium]|nr:DUF3458 domain-containing protein [Gammaproteobacteria bacterium]